MSEQSTILVVEDQIETAEMFAEMLKLSGYRVVITNVSREAMRLVAQEKPTAVILDIMMPDISGLEVLKYMRAEDEFKNTPVIVVSAKSLPDDVKAGFDEGATEYLTKPVSFMDLKKAVEDALA